jgi:PhnB protein
MSLTPLVNFNGDCKEAFHFYAATFGGKLEFLMSWGSSPMAAEVPAQWQQKILYGRVAIGDRELIGGDAPPGSYQKPQGISLQYRPQDAADAARVFAALADGGSVSLPLQKTFWSESYGMVTDRFGVPWEVNCE